MLLVNETWTLGKDLPDLLHIAAANGPMKHTGAWRRRLYGKQLLHCVQRISSGWPMLGRRQEQAW